MRAPKPLTVIRRLWKAHAAAPFPEEFPAEGMGLMDFMHVDSTAAGCISTFLHQQGRLDLWGTAILGVCYGDLCAWLHSLDGEAKEYFERLQKLARLVLEAVRDAAAPRDRRPDV